MSEMCQIKVKMKLPFFFLQLALASLAEKTTSRVFTLQETSISHHVKRKIIFKSALGWDILVPGTVIYISFCIFPHFFLEKPLWDFPGRIGLISKGDENLE